MGCAVWWCALVVAIVCGDPLLLTPLVKQGKVTEARNLSEIHPGTGHSAYFTVPSTSGKQNNNIFFWLQPCTQCDPSTSPFMLWFQGGPGAPGTFGALAEIGTHYVDADLTAQERCFTWCKHYSCLFVDQPVMTGFSYPTNSTGHYDPHHIEYTKTSSEAMEQIYEVLMQFYQVFPEYRKSPFYIGGESYGGQYTGHMGYVIHQHNKQLGPSSPNYIHFTGLAVGDPVLDWTSQMPTYPSTLYGMGVIMLDEKQKLEQIFAASVASLKTNCTEAFTQWNSVWNDDGALKESHFTRMTGSSMTENVLLGKDPDGFEYFQKYFAKKEVRSAMHFDGVPTASFAEGGEVYHTMVESGDFCNSSAWIYTTLFLEAGVDIMIYSSTADPLLGPPTTEAGVNAAWDYAEKHLKNGSAAKKAYLNAVKDIWKVESTDSQPAGYARCSAFGGNRFCYTVVRNAGHESPAFEPRSNWDMITRFVEKRSFGPSGDKPASVPTCHQCGGVPPFAGTALYECHKDH